MAGGPLPAFAVAADLESWTGGRIAVSPTSQRTLDAASNYVRRYCGWHIYPELEMDLLLDAPGGHHLRLPSRHVTAITSLTFGDDLAPTDSYRWSASGDIEQLPTSMEWASGFPSGFRTLHAIFTSGYEEVPPELAILVLGIAARALSSPSGVTREQAGQVSLSYATTASGASGGIALLANEREVLEPYRLVGA